MSDNGELLARTIDALADIGAILARQMGEEFPPKDAWVPAAAEVTQEEEPAKLKAKPKPKPKPKAAPKDEQPVEDLDALLTSLMQQLAADGKSPEMKALLGEHGYSKRSEIPEGKKADVIAALRGLE